MNIYPAVDILKGQAVRLRQGRKEDVTVYGRPVEMAERWARAGAQWLHVVDLNGAFAGQSVNSAAVGAILKATKNPVQLGGGIRTLPQIEDWLDRGLARVILGTVAVRDPELVRDACRLFPGKIAVGIDARGGKAAVEGWAEASELGAVELAKAHGYDHVINYREQDFVAEVARITDGKKCEVVYDSVGKDTFDGSLDCLKPLGLLALFGQSSGPVPPFNLGVLAQKGSLYVTRPTMFVYVARRADLEASAELTAGVGSISGHVRRKSRVRGNGKERLTDSARR